jgi:hypothetical protein
MREIKNAYIILVGKSVENPHFKDWETTGCMPLRYIREQCFEDVYALESCLMDVDPWVLLTRC